MATNVFVKFLPANVDDEKLHTLFSSFGPIVSCKVMVNSDSGLSLGYGFVRYTRSEDAMKAISVMMGHRIGSKNLLCKLSDCINVGGLAKTNLYVKPLPSDFTQDQLRELFGKHGNIVSLKIGKFVEKHDYSKIGFVKYESAEGASKAIQNLNGNTLPGQSQPITVKYAISDVQIPEKKASHKSRNQEQTPSHTTASAPNTNEMTSDPHPHQNMNDITHTPSPHPHQNMNEITHTPYPHPPNMNEITHAPYPHPPNMNEITHPNPYTYPRDANEIHSYYQPYYQEADGMWVPPTTMYVPVVWSPTYWAPFYYQQ